MDEHQAINCVNPASGSADTCSWSNNWVLGAKDMLDPGEQVDMTVDLTELITDKLIKSKEFTIQVKPNSGAVVVVNRTVPPEIKNFMTLN